MLFIFEYHWDKRFLSLNLLEDKQSSSVGGFDVFNILYISHIVLISFKLNIALFVYIFRCFMVCSSGFRF